jgi:hypothetical protein
MVKKIGPTFREVYREGMADIRMALDEGGLANVIEWVVNNTPDADRAEVAEWAARHAGVGAHELRKDDLLSALTGMIESRLLWKVEADDGKHYRSVSIVLWNITPTGMPEGIQAQVHLDGGYVGSAGTEYGLNLSNLSQAADKLAEVVSERLVELGYSIPVL